MPGGISALARETLIMTMAVRNGCHICVAMHTASLTRLGAGAGLIALPAARAGDGRLHDRCTVLIPFATRPRAPHVLPLDPGASYLKSISDKPWS